MPLRLTQEAADKTLTNLYDAGLAGAILALLVAPVLLALVRGSQKRQEATDAREDRDAAARQERETQLVRSLVASVEQQKEEWRAFETEEKQTHSAILTNLAQMTTTLAKIADKLTP